MTSPTSELNLDLLQERLRLHQAAVPGSAVSALGIAVALALLLRHTVPLAQGLTWGLALALALAVRLAVYHGHKQHAERLPAPVWLRRYRLSCLLHGLVWMAGALLVLGLPQPQPLVMLVFALTVLTAGALITASFDGVAALAFSLPTLLPLTLGLFLNGHSGALVSSAVALIFLAVLGLALRRAELNLCLGAQQRLHLAREAADAQQARAALADQHALMTQVLATTGQGSWFIDTEGRTTEINAAMCELLGRPREAIVGRRVQDFFAGADLERLQRELALRPRGQRSVYEISILRPDGTRRHCQNHAGPIHDAQGRFVGSVGLWTDVTAIVEAARALQVHAWALNSLTDVVSVLDEHEVYRMVNDTWCRKTGMPREQVLGRRAQDFLPALATERRSQLLRDCLRTDAVQTQQTVLDLPAVRGRQLLTHYYPFRGQEAGAAYVVQVTRDVTDEQAAMRALQASELTKQALLEAFPGFIARLDSRLVYQFVNRRFAELAGRTAEDIVGHSAWELYEPQRAALIAEEGRRTLAGETVISERRFGGEDGRPEQYIQLTTAAGVDPVSGEPLFYAFGTDITGLHQARQAMAEARAEAERANRAKSQFLAHMSHELRTPLNAILGFTQLLATDPKLQLDARQHGFLQQIRRGGDHLLGLINEVLELGRIEAGQLALQTQTVPLAALMADVQALVRPLAEARGLALVSARAEPQDLAVAADPRRLKQVLLNLLGNAIKYNRRDGEVALTCAAEGGSVRICVRDTGPGIAPADQQRIFEPFERLPQQHSEVEGTGIGVALSRRLVQAMGGELGLDSSPGAGSTFWLRLPRASPPASDVPELPPPAPAPEAPAPVVPVQQHTVLYIEDNPVNLLLMAEMLALMPDVRPVCEISPVEGLARALREPPALILLDLQMPVMDGYEVLRRLQQEPATRQIPVYAVSANALRRDIDAALAAGFAAYLTKPLDVATLTAAVRQALQARGPAAG